ncbi:MAG: histidinol-phosphatase HisJ family protein [Coriobacteriia bacterium]|nr:histidinol-phosphatase HisJ family protein [Coriobacteriia bacterium]
MIDLHVHTSRCGHATGEFADYVRQAEATGIDVLGITDHLPLPESVLAADPSATRYAMPESELEAYVGDVFDAQTRTASQGGPRILLGIEADYIPGEEYHTRELLSRYSFDLVLGSVHMIDGWAFDDPKLIDGYERWDIGALWDRYFSRVAEAAATGLFDVMAHADLVKKFRFFPDDDLDPRYRRLADALADTDVAIEVNTAGLRKPCAELYPSLALLKTFCRAGVPVTIGSDAHAPSEVGYGYDLAVEAVMAAGYRSVVVFEHRVSQEVRL